MNKIISRLFDQSLVSELNDVLITEQQNGQYILFNRYLIKPLDQGHYLVVDSNTRYKVELSSLKNATSWCTLYHAKRWKEARRLVTLDLKFCSITTEIINQRRLLKININSDQKLIHVIKLQEETYKRRQILDELETYINSSKQIQISNFAKRTKVARFV